MFTYRGPFSGSVVGRPEVAFLELDAFTASCYADIVFGKYSRCETQMTVSDVVAGWACEHVRDVLQ